MENVSRRVLDKNKEHYLSCNDKFKKSYDISRHIQLHMSKYKNDLQKKNVQSIISNIQHNCFLKVDFQKVDQHTGSKWLIHDTTLQGQSVSVAWNSALEYISWVSRCDIKGFDGTMLNPIFWKKVQGQKHPGMWEIEEHKIPSGKMLFKMNTNSY